MSIFKNLGNTPSIELEGGIVGTQIGIKTRGFAAQIDPVITALNSLAPDTYSTSLASIEASIDEKVVVGDQSPTLSSTKRVMKISVQSRELGSSTPDNFE